MIEIVEFIKGFDLHTIITVAVGLFFMMRNLNKKFEKIDQRFEKIDERFERIDQKFDRIYDRFHKISEEHKSFHEQFTKLNFRLGRIEGILSVQGFWEYWKHEQKEKQIEGENE